MARGRMIDKRISKSDKLAALTLERSRTLYFMIYPHLDCEGRYSGDPRDIKEDCCPRLPYTISQVADSLIDLHNVGLIHLYEVDNKPYIEADRFEDFQPGLRKDREAPSDIPAYSGPSPESSGVPRSWSALSLRLKLSLSLSINPPLSSPPSSPQKVQKFKIRLVLDDGQKRWEGITDEDRELWRKTYPKIDIDQVLDEMIAFWDAKPKSELKKDWKKAIVNRLSWLQTHMKDRYKGPISISEKYVGKNRKSQSPKDKEISCQVEAYAKSLFEAKAAEINGCTERGDKAGYEKIIAETEHQIALKARELSERTALLEEAPL